FVLGDQRTGLDRHRPLDERRRETLCERGDPGDVRHPGLCIANPELYRPELWMGPDVPPDIAVVGEEARLRAAGHEPFEIGERAQAGWQPAARHHVEDLAARRGETGVVSLPVRR